MVRLPIIFYLEIKTALMIPSWPGLEVILALPASVSTIAPLVIMFLLIKCLFAEFPVIVFIFDFWDFFVFVLRRFTYSSLNSLSLLFPPKVLTLLILFLP